MFHKMNASYSFDQANKKMAVKTLYESADYLIVNKPYDMYINSDDENEKNTVTQHIAASDSHLSTSSSPLHFVQRLDYATSGVLCIAKNKSAAARAGKLFEKRLTSKYYLAVLRGHVDFEIADIEYDVGVDPSTMESSHRMVAITTSASSCILPRTAHTRLQVLETGYYGTDPATVVLLKPITGRRHQLRVHCSAVGHTILGDYTYSDTCDTAPHRMFLHATRLKLPLQPETLDIQTPEPFFPDPRFSSQWRPEKMFTKYKSIEEFRAACDVIDKSYVIGVQHKQFICKDPLEGSSYSMNNVTNVKTEDDDDDNYNTMDLLQLAQCVETNQEPIEFNSTDAMVDPKTGQMICLHCLDEFDANLLTDHMVNAHNYRRIVFKCHICQSLFQERRFLLIHRQQCRPPQKHHKRKTFSQIMREVENTLRDDDNMLESISCPICVFEVPKYCLKEHLLTEHRKPEVTLTCELCKRNFKSKLTLKEHIKLVHEAVEDSEQCELCGQKFRSLKYLANHKRNVHPSGNKIHKCEICNKEFKSRLCLHQHIKHVHPPESASVTCPHCPSKTFKSKINLHQHLKVSHGIKRERQNNPM